MFVALTQTLDVRLAVGDVQQTIEVKAEVALLETAAAQRGQNLSPQFLLTCHSTMAVCAARKPFSVTCRA